jgi:NAD+ synthase (glutamine-hydrolysing)
VNFVLRIALLQINPTAGDLNGNSSLIVSAARAAQSQGADLVVTPELALMGYLPRDLLMNQGFVRRSGEMLARIAAELADAPPLLVGVATPNPSDMGRPLFNSAVLLRNGAVGPAFHKTLLPTYDVFDEDRYFEPAQGPQILELGGWRLGISICEDVWNDRDFWKRRRYHQDPIEVLTQAGAQAIVNLSASPFTVGKQLLREQMLGHLARKHGLPLVFVNQVGGNDDLIFDGRSGAFDAQGRLFARAKGFEEDVVVVDLAAGPPFGPGAIAEDDFEPEAEIWNALVLGVRDYARKTRFRKVLLGLSGGIDSALTAAIAADAMGPENVLGVMMPSLLLEPGQRGRFGRTRAPSRNPDHRIAHRRHHADLRCRAGRGFSRVCARRDRGEHSIAHPRQPVNGAFQQVRFAAAHHRQQVGDVGGLLHAVRRHEWRPGGDRGPAEDDGVPGFAMAKPAPAGHSRSDSHQGAFGRIAAGPDGSRQPPALRLLDQILELHVEQCQSAEEIIAQGFDEPTVRRVLRLVRIAEFKRKQAAPVLKVTSRAFGTGWRMPIVRQE